jgi:predicted transcriptional regulator
MDPIKRCEFARKMRIIAENIDQSVQRLARRALCDRILVREVRQGFYDIQDEECNARQELNIDAKGV